MATLTLTKLWINLLSDGTAFSGYTAVGRKRTTAQTGDVRTYAGGRRRSFTVEGIATGYAFTVVNVTLTEALTLEGWIGQPVQVRDHRGQRHYGVYYSVGIDEQGRDGYYTVDINLESITVDEG